VDNLKFRFKAYKDHDKVVVHIVVDGAEAIFRYNNPDAVSMIAENMKQILDYAIEDYMVREKFKDQIENELEEWINDEGSG